MGGRAGEALVVGRRAEGLPVGVGEDVVVEGFAVFGAAVDDGDGDDGMGGDVGVVDLGFVVDLVGVELAVGEEADLEDGAVGG